MNKMAIEKYLFRVVSTPEAKERVLNYKVNGIPQEYLIEFDLNGCKTIGLNYYIEGSSILIRRDADKQTAIRVIIASLGDIQSINLKKKLEEWTGEDLLKY